MSGDLSDEGMGFVSWKMVQGYPGMVPGKRNPSAQKTSTNCRKTIIAAVPKDRVQDRSQTNPLPRHWVVPLKYSTKKLADSVSTDIDKAKKMDHLVAWY
ncbi:hypothetical protein B0T21DRAFT_408940 [Apiosordaria backusii]|uniref:Uncharacterized protein n=1 Tax=Apiosordaria backusii TaxID=314023 RepID=A0AA40EMM8_9PEZI|nr:hypothetical protein B0T21DRAFT_408940 [Apiosordaria backusii]